MIDTPEAMSFCIFEDFERMIAVQRWLVEKLSNSRSYFHARYKGLTFSENSINFLQKIANTPLCELRGHRVGLGVLQGKNVLTISLEYTGQSVELLDIFHKVRLARITVELVQFEIYAQLLGGLHLCLQIYR